MTADRPDAGPLTEQEEQPVSALELFFDLVFVFTLTQLTAMLADDISARGILQVVLIFAVLWWMYTAYAWLTNVVPPDRALRRIGLMVGMGAFLVCALAIPRAFDGGGVAFGIGYLAVIVVHGALFAQVASLGALARFVPSNIVAALLIVGAGLVEVPTLRYALWAAAIVVQVAAPYIFGAPMRFTLRTAHFVERHGLLLIVAFGESVVAIGIGTSDLPIGPSMFAAAVLGLALAATLWWTYFGDDEAGAEHALAAAPANVRSQLAINAYFVSFAPMLVGVIVISAGVKKSLGHVFEALPLAAALAVAGGVVLYLVGDVVFRRVLGIRPVRYRLVAAVVALLTTALGVWVAAAAELVALLAVLALALGAESRHPRPTDRTGRAANILS